MRERGEKEKRQRGERIQEKEVRKRTQKGERGG